MFVLMGVVGDKFQKLINTSNTLRVSFSNAKQIFSLIDMSLSKYDPMECVKTWLISHRMQDHQRMLK